ncbi:hypothetical protein [Streptomyces albidoflavus]|uniref:hypothetical protein n=1 Tax=Streptomyces albidoflavus TaxID=1886 RepID=UPI000FECFC2A|nr:hypothetical protein [Streptomyces albidoflavus]RWZ76253.1 hypothetical protein EQK42_09470 [Streptomyces albidoflavus]
MTARTAGGAATAAYARGTRGPDASWTSTPAGQRLARGAPVTVRPSAWRAAREPGGAAQAAEQLPEHS